MAAGGRGKPSPSPAKHSPTTPKDHPLGMGIRNTLSPGEFPVQRPRRLSAPCGPQQCTSAPSSPAHRPSVSPRATSPCGARSDAGQAGKMSSDAWVCPNDRQLALRAKLHSGWSVKTATINQWKQPDPLSSSEQQMIVDVIKRAEQMEKAEKQRLERLMERLQNMRNNAAGDGENNCILCGEAFSFFTRQKNLMCADCNKAVCTKCGVECTTPACGSTPKEIAWLCKICAESREMWKKSGAWFFKGMPKQEKEEEMPPPNLGDGHKKERRFTVYKPTRTEKDELTEVEVEESSEDEATGELAKRGLTKLGDNRSESDLSGPLSIVSNFSSMESLNTLESARRLSDVGYGYGRGTPRQGFPRCPSPRASPGPFRARPPGARPFPPGHPRPPVPPWTQNPGARGSLHSPRCRPPPPFSPRGSPRCYPRGRYPSPRGGRQSRPLSCPPRGPPSAPGSPSQTPDILPSKLSSPSPSPSDSELTEVPLSSLTSPDSKNKNSKGNGEGMFSTLRRLSTVSRKTRSKKKLLDLDKDIDVISEQESGTDTGTSGFVRPESRSLGSDDTGSSPRTPDGSSGILEFALIYDEINQLLLVNILRAKSLKGLDVNGLCDSYCKVTLQPPVKDVNQQRTRTIPKNISPEYASLLHFPGIDKSDLTKLHMHIAILDEDISGDHLLAEARVSLVKIFPQMQKQFQVCLHRPTFKDGEDGFIVANNCGRIELSLSFYSQHGTLKVGIIRCSGLAASDPQNNSSDPFVRVVLMPESGSDCRKKTTIKWGATDPEFNEQFVFMTNIVDLPKQSLAVTVWDHDKLKQNDYIGGLILGLNAKGERLRHWANLIKHPNRVHTKTHSLSANFLS